MKKEEWEALISSHGWKPFQAFLRDRRMDVMEALAGNHLMDADTGKAIKECVIYKELAELTWPQIAKFYNVPEDKEDK